MRSRLLLALAGLVFSQAVGAADPAAISQKATTWRAQHEREILQEFSDLLSIPNLASVTVAPFDLE